MNSPLIRSLIAAGAVLVAAGACAATPEAAANKSDRSEAQQRYEREAAVCNSGRSNQDRATCLREAGAALAEARRGALGTGNDDFTRNQTLRCEPLPPSQRADCMARMQGQGSTSGSAAAGGVYRELVTRDDAGATPPKPGAQPAPTTPAPKP